MTKLHLALLGLAISGISAAPQGIEPRRTDDQYYGPAQFWTEGHYRSSYDGRNGFRLHDIDVQTQKCMTHKELSTKIWHQDYVDKISSYFIASNVACWIFEYAHPLLSA
ncbi:hypothetical protein EDB80DRAFT_810456 [Ilyonectria destructans]|nr:hypothetical protein EDB80DRAFT_810456 [Ilyonectria destructans]